MNFVRFVHSSIIINTFWADPHSDLLQNALVKPKNIVKFGFLTINPSESPVLAVVFASQLSLDFLAIFLEYLQCKVRYVRTKNGSIPCKWPQIQNLIVEVNDADFR